MPSVQERAEGRNKMGALPSLERRKFDGDEGDKRSWLPAKSNSGSIKTYSIDRASFQKEI